MNDGQAQGLLNAHADAINGYREYLRKKVDECREKLEKEIDRTIRNAEFGDFESISPSRLSKLRAELEAYGSAYNALEDHIKTAAS